jgi:hypothetical protein
MGTTKRIVTMLGYYYLPDIQAYYDIRASQLIHYGGRNWARPLPRQYRNYDCTTVTKWY